MWMVYWRNCIHIFEQEAKTIERVSIMNTSLSSALRTTYYRYVSILGIVWCLIFELQDPFSHNNTLSLEMSRIHQLWFMNKAHVKTRERSGDWFRLFPRVLSQVLNYIRTETSDAWGNWSPYDTNTTYVRESQRSNNTSWFFLKKKNVSVWRYVIRT